MQQTERSGLIRRQVEDFHCDDFFIFGNANTTALETRCRDELWLDIDLSRDEPENSSKPLIRVAFWGASLLIEAVDTTITRGFSDPPVDARRWYPSEGGAKKRRSILDG